MCVYIITCFAITCYWMIEISQNVVTRFSIEVKFKFQKDFCKKGP